jgi:hypothetical protein
VTVMMLSIVLVVEARNQHMSRDLRLSAFFFRQAAKCRVPARAAAGAGRQP